MLRLQEKEWYDYRRKHHLTLLCVSSSKAGNYRADCIDENGTLVYHWLSSREKDKLDNSNYFKTHKLIDSNKVLHSDGSLFQRMRKGEVINLLEKDEI